MTSFIQFIKMLKSGNTPQGIKCRTLLSIFLTVSVIILEFVIYYTNWDSIPDMIQYDYDFSGQAHDIFEKKWKMQYKECAVPHFEWIDKTQCVAGFSTRKGGLSQGVYASMNVGLHSKDDHELVVANRKKLFSTVAQELQPVNLHQIHSADIIRVEKEYEKEVQADGFYTTERGVLLTISIADCGSVLFHDDDFTVVGALHCGWRGTRDGVIQNMLRELSQFVELQKLSAYIGPMISKENYEVGPEFQEYFPAEFLTARNNSLYLD